MTHSIPRPEHPRPDFQRENWLNLNGEWQFAFDEDDKGLAGKWYVPGVALPEKITVPFCYQSKPAGFTTSACVPLCGTSAPSHCRKACGTDACSCASARWTIAARFT